MTTLITGAGMLGSLAAARIVSERGERPVLYDIGFSERNLSERLAGGSVELVKGDIGDIGDLLRAVESYGVDRIIHTASLLTRDLIPRPVAGVRVNVMGTLNVLEAVRLAGLRRVVFCSSTVVTMGRRRVAPADDTVEDFTLSVVSEYPPSLYASMKLASETKYGNPTSPMDLTASRRDLGYRVEYPMGAAVADYLDWLAAAEPDKPS